jgi:putative molybdopterin biosynthesis protein
MGKRNLYLNNTPVEEARIIYENALKNRIKMDYEEIPTEASLGRITKEAVFALCSSPLFNAAAMDGIAVIAERTKGASDREPLELKKHEDFIIVDTGDPVKYPYDAVIMAEDVIEMEDGSIKILEAATPWQHIRPVGEDIVVGEMLLASMHKIRPIDIGVLFSGGITNVKVVKQPKVAIFPTGTEIIEPGEVPKDGDIIESNSRMFEAMVDSYGGIAERFSPIEDDYDKIKNAVSGALDYCDMVIVNAGSSAGTEDYTVHVLRELGEVLVHGVAIKPGKPVILAVIKNKPVIGLPGYPVSAYIGFETFVKPILSMFTGEHGYDSNKVNAVLSKRLVSSLKHKEYVRVKVGEVDGRLVASPLSRGAGAAMSLVRADGFCVIDQNCEGIEAGEAVNVELYRSLSEIRHTLVSIGSHDLILDIIGDLMSIHNPGIYMSSTHVGSMGGLMALRRGEAHMVPVHLLDEESGVYNIPYLIRLFKEPMALIKGVKRIQGLMIQKGNPRMIKGIEDLADCRYVNRQRGAGTRVLFDYKLKLSGMDASLISGYDREASTHMAAAALVASNSADAALGIYAAASAMDLEFLPIGEEEYDFAVPVKYLDLPEMQSFLQVLKSKELHRRMDEIGGYQYDMAGEITFIHQ